ncbi:UDP-glycosyltransferase UGT5-like [Battus philenor]|uniref:UDP-glycosyltransferase UGT5-like n=1 Tax=Battus philenor TaxID=42288 RepID=UPI0035D0D36F
MVLKYLRVILLLHAVVGIEAANILALYPCPSISHQIVFRPLTLELLKRGHSVTVLTTDPIFPKGGAPENLTEIDAHDMSYEIIRKNIAQSVTGNKNDFIAQFANGRELFLSLLEEQSKIKEFNELLNNKTQEFDLIFVEAFFSTFLGITHIYKAPTILVSSFGGFQDSHEIIGTPIHPFLYPNVFRHKLYNLSLWDKISELYNYLIIKYIMNDYNGNERAVMKRIFGPDVPPLSVLKNNVDMLLLNINPIWEGNFPVPPSVIYMGGLHQNPPKELPKELQQYLDASKNGVIYFSFGTNVQTSILPPEKIAIFRDVLSQLPYNVILKWDSENSPFKSDNIRVFKWLPQSDLLHHPNVKLFITQGGLQSTDEAITAGVPLIGVPMLGDQWYNVEKYVHHQIGIRLDFDKLTEDQLKNAVLEVIQNERYRNNILRLRSLMQDQPQKPLERAMWWIEYVLRHGGAKHLRAPAANMSWAEYLELELVSVLLLAIVSLTVIFVLLTKLIITLVWRTVRRDKKPKRE